MLTRPLNELVLRRPRPRGSQVRRFESFVTGDGERMKSTVDEIRQRFDQDVERFSNLETGQSATIDAALAMNLIARAAAMITPAARRALDVGCGAGNYALKLLEVLPDLEIDLLDLSRPMLDRAAQRVGLVCRREVRTLHGDMRNVSLDAERYDIIVAASTLHHLRSDDEWEQVFARFYRSLRPGGAIWISDLIEHSSPAIHTLMLERYGEYLVALKGKDYRDEVFAYIEKEDTPRPLMYQIDLLRRVGFGSIELLHKNSVFATWGAIKE